MNGQKTPGSLLFIITLALFFPAKAAEIAVPKGFEAIFNSRQQEVVEILYSDESLGTLSIEYDRNQVLLHSPNLLVEQITAVEMPPLKITAAELLALLSRPLERVGPQGSADKDIVVWLDESNSSLSLIFPGSLFSTERPDRQHTYLRHLSTSGFVHSHNLNYLTDSYGDSYSISASETLNLTGNSYLKSDWNYASNVDVQLEEFALYLEHENKRFKAGRQRMSDNLNNSTPSVNYSFFNPVSFDGISFGYMSDNFVFQGSGAASPVVLYLAQAGTVEIYRNGRLIDLQHFPAGLQHLDTRSWPSGGYNVLLVTKLANGAREETTQSFFKRTGAFRAGEIEYITQFGRYDPHQGERSPSKTQNCRDCLSNTHSESFNNHTFANLAVAWTTESAFSLGSGVLVDDRLVYGTGSLDIPINSWLTERVYIDGIFGDKNSLGYQLGMMKSLPYLGLNASYRHYQYRGEKQAYRRYGLVPAYDLETLQFGANTFLPWNMALGLNYGLNTFYQEFGRQHKTEFENWDLTLNRDFVLSTQLNLRVDLGYHHGINTYSSRQNHNAVTENRLYTQLSLGMRERSHNHYQALHLRSRMTDNRSDNVYSADYTLDLDNPEFDRGSKYALGISTDRGPGNTTNTGVSATVDNRFGYTSAGTSRSFGSSDYNQHYLSQRSGFAIGEGVMAWGKVESDAALIVDADTLPEDHYYVVSNSHREPVVIKGGQSTTLNITPYQKVAPEAEQLFTSDLSAFYHLSTQTQSTRAMPGQVYHVKLKATQNLTVIGRLLHGGQPLSEARIVGANALSDEEGLFVGDFSLETQHQLTSLSVSKEGQTYRCPLNAQEIKMTQGIMQIREVNCESQ
ncbi:TcfC E-set like domain-containing protein [Erwinia sp.]|uniref:TcfC E-set like domain-containing protein n=1 Tax=Erwinia citreus TaxID=558 RepID=UPI003C74215A